VKIEARVELGIGRTEVALNSLSEESKRYDAASS
jgi:hypothetical protein